MKIAVMILTAFLSAFAVSVRAQQSPPPSAVGASPDEAKAASKKAELALPPEKANPVSIARFDRPPVIDGRLDDDVWKTAAVLKDFYQINPGDNIAPSKSTEVLIGYDAKFLYIAFRAPDEPGKVRANVPKRDDIFDDDNVGMFLDTFDDKRKAYALFFNPLGVQADGILTEGRGEDYSVDIVMESKGVVSEDGYTVEIAIPFKSLRYEAGKDKVWNAHFFRRIKRFNNELDSWMPISRDKSGTMNQAGRITGLEGISTERTLEIIPTLTLSESGRRARTLPFSAVLNNPALNDPGRFVNSPVAFDPGLTLKFGITPTVTLDFAANPDFAQVEADQPVVTANQRFPIFFSEKRPFFLEGIDIFQTPLQAVHTRAIIDPDLAVKLSGKIGRNSFGLMLASDNAPGNFSEEERTSPDILPGIQRFLDKNAYIGVLRLKRDVGKESSIGLIATSYNFIEKHNQLGGIDGRFLLDKQTTFTFQALGTTSRRFFFDPDLGESVYRTGNSFAYYHNYNKSGRNFGYNINGQGRTRDYRADVGFTRRTNTNFEELFVRYNSEPNPKARLISLRVFNSARTNFDWSGRMQNWENEAQISFSFARQTFWGIGYVGGYERLFEEEFGVRRKTSRAGAFFGGPERSAYSNTAYTFFETNPTQKYAANLFLLHTWGAFDFDFGAGPRFPRVSPAALANPKAGLDPGIGNSLFMDAGFSYQPVPALRSSLNYTKSRLERDDTGRVAFDDNIFSWRTTYQFTRFTFARGRIDYTTLGARVRGQYLLGWTPNPGTSFYVGYNDDMSYNGFSPFTFREERGLHRNSRTFFIKMSYLIRKSF